MGPENKCTGFTYRKIEYEKVHQIEDADFEKMVDAINPKLGDTILDGMDGYGAVSKWILKRTKEQGFKPEIFTLDECPTQIDRARQNVPDIDEKHIVEADIRETGFPNEKFDTVAIKMGIHEVPKVEQINIFREVYRILKPKGKFVIWELSLNTDNQKIFQDIIREKDRLSGFDLLVQNRYFPRHDELTKLFAQAGFVDVRDFHNIIYCGHTGLRKDEVVSKERALKYEKNGKISKKDEIELRAKSLVRVRILTEFAKKEMQKLPEDSQENMHYKTFLDPELGIEVAQFQVDKIIMVGYKK